MAAQDKKAVGIDDLFEIILVGDAQVHPSGERVAFVRKTVDADKDEYEANIWIWEGGNQRQYSSGKKDSSPRWSPDGSRLAFVSGRGEKPGIFVLSMLGGEAVRVTDEKLEAGGFAWSPDGSRIVFSATVLTDEFGNDRDEDEEAKRKPEEGKSKKPAKTKLIERAGFKADGVGFVHDRRSHLHVVDVDSRVVKRLTEGDYSASSPAWSPDGRHIAFAADRNPRWDVEIDSQIWQVPAEGGEPACLTKERGSWGRPVYSPSGKHVAFLGMPITDDRPVTGYTRLWRVDRRGSDMTDLMDGQDVDIDNSILSDSKLQAADRLIWTETGIWFLATQAGAANVFRWNNGLRQETQGLQDVRDFSVAGDALAYTASTLTEPAEIFLRRGRQKPKQITDFNADYLASRIMTMPEPVSFAGSKGDTVHGWIMRPSGDQLSHPLVLYVHGGPQAAYGNGFFHEMQVLAAEGFGVLLINPHGSSSHGEAYESAIHGAWGERDFEDFMAAADMAAGLEWVDDSRMAIAGGSYGGYTGAWVIGHTDRFAAAVVERSLVNMLSFVGTTDIPNWWEYAWRTTIEADPMKLWKMSPIAYLGTMKTPTLVIHSENDHRCPIEQGEQLFTGLRRMGVPTRFVRFPDESHGLSRGGRPSRRVERLNEILNWLKRYV